MVLVSVAVTLAVIGVIKLALTSVTGVGIGSGAGLCPLPCAELVETPASSFSSHFLLFFHLSLIFFIIFLIFLSCGVLF